MRTLRPLPLLALMLCAALILAGCDSAEMARQFDAYRVQAQQSAVAAEPGNRLLVQGLDGNIYTMRPDGSQVIALTREASATRQFMQPTWSPMGDEIVYTDILVQEGALENSVVIAMHDGSERTEYAAPYAPFYYSWSPDGQRLAYLSNWMTLNEPSIALRLLDRASDAPEEIRTLAEGQPLYFSWSPDGLEMITHIDGERIEVQHVDGNRRAVLSPDVIPSPAFPAPQWSDDGSRLLYAITSPTGHQLVAANAGGEIVQEITDFEEQISFGLSPDGERVAYVLTPNDVAFAGFGPLYVTELETNRTRELSAAPVMAFFWSPDGQKLAYLAVEQRGETIRLRWLVWDGSRSTPYAWVLPTRIFLERYLTFFDQYARSMSIWSPDSSAFVYAATDEANRTGIWVQRLEEGAEAHYVARGVFASWSPR
jgi:TolB protein